MSFEELSSDICNQGVFSIRKRPNLFPSPSLTKYRDSQEFLFPNGSLSDDTI